MISLQRAQRLAPSGSGVPSPCVGICRMSAVTGRCEGCHRTLDEITAWSRASDDDKRAIWALVERRQTDTGSP